MKRMKAERLRRGWNQVVPSYRGKVAVSDYSKIETGRSQPYPAQLKRLAKVFGLKPGELLEEVDDPPTDENLTERPRPAA